MAPTEGGLETGRKACKMKCNRTRISLQIFWIARASGSKTKRAKKRGQGQKKGDKYYLETYLEDVKLLFSADFCVVKAKCYRSMRKTEAPHSLRIVFDSGEVDTQAATQCSCKVGTGKCQHLAALFTHVMAKLRDDDSPTSHLQQWHRPRGPSLEPQRWFESESVKPRIDRTPREMAPKTVQEYLYDPRPVEQRIITETDIKKLGETISINNPTTYASWLQYSNAAKYQSLPWGNFLEGSPLANQLRDVYPRSVVETIYSEDLEAVFDFPVQIISLPEDVRKGPPPSLPDEEKAFLANIILSPEKAIDIEKNKKTREVSRAALLGIKSGHSESLPQDLEMLFLEKPQLMTNSYIVYLH